MKQMQAFEKVIRGIFAYIWFISFVEDFSGFALTYFFNRKKIINIIHGNDNDQDISKAKINETTRPDIVRLHSMFSPRSINNFGVIVYQMRKR